MGVFVRVLIGMAGMIMGMRLMRLIDLNTLGNTRGHHRGCLNIRGDKEPRCCVANDARCVGDLTQYISHEFFLLVP